MIIRQISIIFFLSLMLVISGCSGNKTKTDEKKAKKPKNLLSQKLDKPIAEYASLAETFTKKKRKNREQKSKLFGG